MLPAIRVPHYSPILRYLRTSIGMKIPFTSGYHPEGDGQMGNVLTKPRKFLQVFAKYQQATVRPPSPEICLQKMLLVPPEIPVLAHTGTTPTSWCI